MNPSEVLSRRRVPRTRRGTRTCARLLRSAERAFSRQGYHRTSVAYICRLSQVANGTFYQYFSDKEEIFVALVKHLTQSLDAALAAPRPRSPGAVAHVLALIQSYLSFVQSHARLYQVFREAEFVRLDLSEDFYQRLAARFIELIQHGIQRGELRRCDPEVIAYCLIGLQEFLALRYVIWSHSLTKKQIEMVGSLIQYGIDSGRPLRESWVPPVPSNSNQNKNGGLSLAWGAPTRSRLLAAAEIEFGDRGFYQTNVSEIARRAGVALGTVYLYFRSKQELFVELIHEINHGLRRASAQAFAGLKDRRAIERAGFWAFFEFIRHHRRAYGIVREAEFVDGRAGRWYYLSLGEPYARELELAMGRGELREMPAEPLAYALMGMGHFLGLRWLIWPSYQRRDAGPPPELPSHVFDEAMRFIITGIAA
jgi:AcrR family transcriptional regulator